MRLAVIEKEGFYPHPDHMADATASWFIPPQETHGRLLDPCAGEGEIAPALGELLNCETWGCELFPYLTEKAANRMDKCHSATVQIFARIIRSLVDISSKNSRQLA